MSLSKKWECLFKIPFSVLLLNVKRLDSSWLTVSDDPFIRNNNMFDTILLWMVRVVTGYLSFLNGGLANLVGAKRPCSGGTKHNTAAVTSLSMDIWKADETRVWAATNTKLSYFPPVRAVQPVSVNMRLSLNQMKHIWICPRPDLTYARVPVVRFYEEFE